MFTHQRLMRGKFHSSIWECSFQRLLAFFKPLKHPVYWATCSLFHVPIKPLSVCNKYMTGVSHEIWKILYRQTMKVLMSLRKFAVLLDLLLLESTKYKCRWRQKPKFLTSVPPNSCAARRMTLHMLLLSKIIWLALFYLNEVFYLSGLTDQLLQYILMNSTKVKTLN